MVEIARIGDFVFERPNPLIYRPTWRLGSLSQDRKLPNHTTSLPNHETRSTNATTAPYDPYDPEQNILTTDWSRDTFLLSSLVLARQICHLTV